MKKTIILLSILTLVIGLISSCTGEQNKIINESHNPQSKNEALESNEVNQSADGKKSENNLKNDDESEQGKYEEKEIVRDSTPIIDVATAKNETDYNCKVEIEEGDNGRLIVDIFIKDADGNDIQRLTYQTEFHKEWYDMYVENGGEICRFIDFNFDGYPDVVTQLYGAAVNQWYKVWLYNPTTKEFENSEEYGTQINPKINIHKEFVLSTRYEKGIPSYELSHVENGHLAYQGSIIGEIGNDGKITYIQRMYGYINKDGNLAYREVQSYEKVSSVDDLDELWSAFEIELIE